MDNFYKEHEGYMELKAKLLPLLLSEDLINVVADAIQYGMDKMKETRKGV